MNVGLDCKSTAILAIVLAIISLACMAISFIYALKKHEIMKYLKLGWAYRNTVFHIISFLSLTIYVITHWRYCITMQFFSRFNGNNILFIVWLISAFLIIYDVEGKGFRVAKRKLEEAQNQYETVEKQYALDQIELANKNIISIDPNRTQKGDNKNGS